jgi:hypothetical protein
MIIQISRKIREEYRGMLLAEMVSDPYETAGV